jgi:hypothetical protein
VGIVAAASIEAAATLPHLFLGGTHMEPGITERVAIVETKVSSLDQRVCELKKETKEIIVDLWREVNSLKRKMNRAFLMQISEVLGVIAVILKLFGVI